jgi:predicted sulfurtransferase
MIEIINGAEMKRCSNCQETKNVDEFSKQKSKKDGLTSCCKSCVAEKTSKYREENREGINAKDRERRSIIVSVAGHKTVESKKCSK